MKKKEPKYSMEPNNEGPSCACGKEDLYEVWLKNEKTKNEKQDKASINTEN